MEDLKIGMVLISNEEYRELIEENKRLDLYNDDLIAEKKDLKNKYNGLMEVIKKMVINDQKYHFQNIELEQDKVIEGYHYNYIRDGFYSYEIFDKEYIKNVIIEYKLNQNESVGDGNE